MSTKQKSNLSVKINCYSEISYTMSDKGLVRKNTVRVIPERARERIACEPILGVIANANNLYIDLDKVIWDEVGRNIPDGKVEVRNGSNFWIEHTRIADHYQHFINETLKSKSNKALDELGAPNNLFIVYPNNTQVRAALEFCKTWKEWPMITDWVEGYREAHRSYKEDPTKLVGFIVKEVDFNLPRFYYLEVYPEEPVELFEKAIKEKEQKYGIMAANTVLVLDDETRFHSINKIMASAEEYGSSLATSFRAVYVISFEYLDDNLRPTWKFTPLKEFTL